MSGKVRVQHTSSRSMKTCVAEQGALGRTWDCAGAGAGAGARALTGAKALETRGSRISSSPSSASASVSKRNQHARSSVGNDPCIYKHGSSFPRPRKSTGLGGGEGQEGLDSQVGCKEHCGRRWEQKREGERKLQKHTLSLEFFLPRLVSLEF